MSSIASTPTAGASLAPPAAAGPLTTLSADVPRSLADRFAESFKEFEETVVFFGETPAPMQQKFVKVMVHDIYKMKDLVRQMTEVHEFSDLDPAGFQRLANKILASTTFRTNCNELLAAMADARRLLEDLDQLRPPVAVPSPVADISPPGSPAITPAAEERDEPMDDVDEEDDVEIVTPPTSPRGGESSKAQGKRRDEGRIMEKKCKTCETKEKECVVAKGKRRCTECEGARTKCSFVPEVQRARTRAATRAKTTENTLRPPKQKRGVGSTPQPPARHVPIVEITTRSPAALPSVPAYLTRDSLNTSSNLRLELELARSEVLELQEEVFRLSDALQASERALKQNRERLTHERELFRAQLDRFRSAGSVDG